MKFILYTTSAIGDYSTLLEEAEMKAYVANDLTKYYHRNTWDEALNDVDGVMYKLCGSTSSVYVLIVSLLDIFVKCF